MVVSCTPSFIYLEQKTDSWNNSCSSKREAVRMYFKALHQVYLQSTNKTRPIGIRPARRSVIWNMDCGKLLEHILAKKQRKEK